MRLIEFIRQLRAWLHYRRAAFVNTREELEVAMRLMPPRIVVDGDEALRAFAAGLTAGEDPEAAPQPEAQSTAFLVVPPVGRIRDGHRTSAKQKAAARRTFKGGMDLVLVAVTGVSAALIVEWLSFPTEPHLVERAHSRVAGKLIEHAAAPASWLSLWAVRVAIPLFGLIAVAAFAWVIWQASGLGRPLKTEWRLEYRIHGRLVMARVRRRAV
jgi:hypothetical protein